MNTSGIINISQNEIDQVSGGVYSPTVPYVCYILISRDGADEKRFALTRVMPESEKKAIKQEIFALEKQGYTHKPCYVPM